MYVLLSMSFLLPHGYALEVLHLQMFWGKGSTPITHMMYSRSVTSSQTQLFGSKSAF